MRRQSVYLFTVLFFILVNFPFRLTAGNTPRPAGQLSPMENWSKPYQEFHELVVKIDSEVERNYWPEIMMVRDGHIVATVQIDSFAARVLREADEVLLPYRQGLQSCVDANGSEYRTGKTASYEYFAWLLDNYVRTLDKVLENQEEPPRTNGVKERKVTTDRAIYAFTKLLMGYLEERTERFKTMDSPHYAADRAVLASLNDLARRVFHVDLSEKFDRKEAVEKGIRSQPVLRDLASNEGGADLSLGIDPLAHLVRDSGSEPTCKVVLPTRKVAVSQ